MSEARHTPPPCKITGESADGKWITIEGAPDEWERLEVHVISDDCDYETAKASAEFIVRAYNSFEALRDACEKAKTVLRAVESVYPGRFATNALNWLEAALAQAEEKR